VIVGDGVAKALHVHPGARLSLNIATREGALNSLEFDVVGVFRSHSKEFDEHAIRVPLEAAQSLLATEGVNEVVVELADTQATDRIALVLDTALAGQGYEVRTWRDLADFYTKTIRLFDRQFGFLQIVLLLMIVLSVSNTINTATFERLPEFGTMLALGDRRRDIFRLIMFECLILGILGGALGIALGTLFALGISAFGIPMPPPPNTDIGYIAVIRIVPGVLMSALSVGILSATLAGVLPSLKIARTLPVEALRRAL
jgi:putative ABC transport system permease protein